ncbi:MAG: hypothetical protein KatS3mg131_3399 [Candidatus Tectimicrobiota bacterium]|nr:MAG: hypothetical protein KatS3mg131_3399 [Candidatus Tectomicrobia bacterium]
MATQRTRRRFTVDEYEQMGRAGILGEDDRVELIAGEIVEMTPIGSRHAACVARLTHLLSHQLGSRAIVWVQNPLRLGALSEPQPDLCLLKPREDFYAAGHPGPQDVLLLVEVAETSVASDREVKLPLYSRFGLPEVWLVNLPEACLEVYRQPAPAGYQETRRFGRGDCLAPLAFPDLALVVDDVLA